MRYIDEDGNVRRPEDNPQEKDWLNDDMDEDTLALLDKEKREHPEWFPF